MITNTFQQIKKILETKSHILITIGANPSGDAISSALAFYLIIKYLGKKAKIAVDTSLFPINQIFDFLPEFKTIQNNILPNKDVILEFEIGNSKINGLTYSVKNNKLLIRIFPDGKLEFSDSPRVKKNDYPYDLIVVLDASDLDSLGKIYEENTEFFYNTPIINIDHKPENEHFGEINFVELTSTSTCEILFSLAETIDRTMLDEKISTCLLTGIIHESRSFQTPNVTPRSLAIASELMARGADRGQIIEKIFYNKAANSLQLWGRVLSRLKTTYRSGDEPRSDAGTIGAKDGTNEGDISWSWADENDFAETGATEQNIFSIAEDFVMKTPESDSSILVYKYKKDAPMRAIVHTSRVNIDLRKALYKFHAFGSKNFVICELPTDNKNESIETIKQLISAQ